MIAGRWAAELGQATAHRDDGRGRISSTELESFGTLAEKFLRRRDRRPFNFDGIPEHWFSTLSLPGFLRGSDGQ
jgi:hypothetical protein